MSRNNFNLTKKYTLHNKYVYLMTNLWIIQFNSEPGVFDHVGWLLVYYIQFIYGSTADDNKTDFSIGKR